MRDVIDAALSEDLEAEAALRENWGIRIQRDPEGFIVANNPVLLKASFGGSAWEGRHGASLRKLPGTHGAKAYFGARQHRGTFIPADLIDG